ncbi:MAG: hypothetical protein AB8E15_05050 [Bdellovibrionales bacterium]
MNRSSSNHYTQLDRSLPLGSLGLEYDFRNDDLRLRFLFLSRKVRDSFFPHSSNWFPDNKINNFVFDGTQLFIPEDTGFKFQSDRILENADKDNVFLKLEHTLDESDFGLYVYRAMSAPSFFFDLSTSAVVVDGEAALQATSDIEIIPTYFRTEGFSLFFNRQFEEWIFRSEFASRKDKSEINYIALNETQTILQLETNQYVGNISIMHVFSLSKIWDDFSSDTSYKLLRNSMIYANRVSWNEKWSTQLLLLTDFFNTQTRTYELFRSHAIQASILWLINDSSEYQLKVGSINSNSRNLVENFNRKDYIQLLHKWSF